MSNELSDAELDQLVNLARRVIWSPPEVRRKLHDRQINITPANFYSNIPMISDIENSFEYRTPNLDVYNSELFDKETLCDFIDTISVYANEFSPPLDGDKENPEEFFWKNPAFSFSDAMAYYCVLRHFKPNHVVEIGSGFSTLIANQALRKNGIGKITLIEPYPKEFLKSLETVDTIIESFVQDIPIAEIIELVENSDVWFIDSTHTVKVGSDCLYIYLKIMPEISKDIIVHTHDVFLPFAAPIQFALDKHIYWTEQYLLYAYMLDNPKIEILFGSSYMEKLVPEAMKKLMSNKYPGGGSSIWYRLNGTN